jgi:DSF synthase
MQLLQESMSHNFFHNDADILHSQDSGALALLVDSPASRTPAKRSSLPTSLGLGSYKQLSVSLDPNQAALWWCARHQGVPCFTQALLDEIKSVRQVARKLLRDRQPGEPAAVKFLVGCSDFRGVFSLGGDLSHFKHCITTRDAEALRAYAYACVEAMYENVFGFAQPIITIGVIEGDALGGGFEAALGFHVMIAERGVKMGFPEVLFNAFPGMGAYSYLARRIDQRAAERMILSGAVYPAEELYEMGVVDVLAEPGQGREAARRFMRENSRRQSVLFAINKVKQRFGAPTLEELRDITDIWVDAMMALEPQDLRKMEILHAAQLRRMRRNAAAAGSA